MSSLLLPNTKYEIRNTIVQFLLALFTLITYFLVFSTSPVFAQTNATSSATTYKSAAYISPQSPNNATKAIYDFGHALSCILGGSSPIGPCLEYKFTKNLQGSISGTPYLSSVNTSGGLLGMSGSMIAMLYQEKPLDQMSFMTYMGRNIGLVENANAQVGGSGNQVLSPIFALWTVSRNIAYLVMILVFIVIGLMVMFRQKLNPQTVVTAQMALPGLVIGLILITFSYFLAALITDTAYIGTDLVGYYFDQAIIANGGSPATKSLTENLANDSAISIGAGATKILDHATLQGFVQQLYDKLPAQTINPISAESSLNPRGVIKLFSAAMTYMFYNSLLSPVFDLAGGVAGGIGGIARIAGVLTPGKANIVGAVGTALGGFGTAAAAGWAIAAYNDPVGYITFWVSILAILILLYTILKLFMRLINCYLMIIFLTISSPFVFLASSLPGRQGMVTDWIRNMLCNVLSFPAVIGVFYFAAFLLGNNEIPAFGVTSQLNLTAGSANLPFLGGLHLDLLRKILAFGAILATPSIPDVICKSVGKPGQAGGILGGAISGAIAGGRNYEGQIQNQITGAGRDVGSWKHAMFGRREYTGGRLGELQTRLHGVEDPSYTHYVGDPGVRKGIPGWINTNILNQLRGSQPGSISQNPYQVHENAEQNRKRGGFGA